MVEITATEHRIKKNEDTLTDLQDNIKHTNIHIIGVPEGEDREKGPKIQCTFHLTHCGIHLYKFHSGHLDMFQVST